MNVEVDVLGSLFLIVLMVSVDVEHHAQRRRRQQTQSLKTVWKSKWPSWAPASLIFLTVSVDVKQH